jgi:hypothetical protein
VNMRKITPAQANAAYDILIKYAGVRERRGVRYSFIHHVSCAEHPTDEYRFMGSLGFGGKFRNNLNHGNTPHVDCYPEDETPERLKVIEATNAALAELFAEAS